MGKETWIWLGLAAGAAALIYMQSSQASQTAAPALSIYPSEAWMTKTTSMAATPAQKATAAVIPPTTAYTSVQQQEQAAILSQCVGAAVCSPLYGDTQLGL